MIYWGLSGYHHDAAIAVVADNRFETPEVLYAEHMERSLGKKNTPEFNRALFHKLARTYGRPDLVVWYERPYINRIRHLVAGDWRRAVSGQERAKLLTLIPTCRLAYAAHHEAHAYLGWATRPRSFNRTAVIVADAVGEMDTTSVWLGEPSKPLRKLTSTRYPHSLGLVYSAVTALVGHKPNEEEGTVMAMAAFGKPVSLEPICYTRTPRKGMPELVCKVNVHRGIEMSGDIFDIAAGAQRLVEDYLGALLVWLMRNHGIDSVVLCGGVALNCSANGKLAFLFPDLNFHISPNPGDAGSSLGAVLAHLQKDNVRTPVGSYGQFLGRDVGWPQVVNVVRVLKDKHMCGVMAGRAEFGPRALGHRSFLADPYAPNIKQVVNDIKGREFFRPLSPVVRLEDADQYFDIPRNVNCRWMNFAVKAKDMCPRSVVHADGTARVQVVYYGDFLHSVLTAWKEATGKDLLINTSLNTKGKPLCDSIIDAKIFSSKTGVDTVSVDGIYSP